MALPLTNIRAAYNLDDSTGNLVDSTGNGYTLVNTGTTTFGAGLINEAAEFGTSNSTKWLATPDACGIALASDWTVSFFWQAATALNGLTVMEIVWGTSGSGNNNRVIGYRDQANNRWGLLNSAFSFSGTTESITNGNWYNFIITRSGSTVTLYINNVSKGSVTVGANTNLTPAIQTRRQDDAGWRFSGDFDMFYVWDKALDSTERSDVYNGGAGVQYAAGAAAPTPTLMMLGIGT